MKMIQFRIKRRCVLIMITKCNVDFGSKSGHSSYVPLNRSVFYQVLRLGSSPVDAPTYNVKREDISIGLSM